MKLITLGLLKIVLIIQLFSFDVDDPDYLPDLPGNYQSVASPVTTRSHTSTASPLVTMTGNQDDNVMDSALHLSISW